MPHVRHRNMKKKKEKGKNKRKTIRVDTYLKVRRRLQFLAVSSQVGE